MKDAINCEKPREVVIDYDPWVSEWGNPVRVMSDDGNLNKIELHEVSRRTETS